MSHFSPVKAITSSLANLVRCANVTPFAGDPCIMPFVYIACILCLNQGSGQYGRAVNKQHQQQSSKVRPHIYIILVPFFNRTGGSCQHVRIAKFLVYQTPSLDDHNRFRPEVYNFDYLTYFYVLSNG